MSKKTVTINGRSYDRLSGMPTDVSWSKIEDSKPAPSTSHATSVHDSLQRSRTLSRRYVTQRTAAPQASVAPEEVVVAAPAEDSPAEHQPSAPEVVPVRHTISKFHRPDKVAQAPQAPPARQIADIGPTTHPVIQRIEKAKPVAPVAVQTHKPSDILKKEAIDEALDQAPSHKETKSTRHRDKPKKSHKKAIFQRRLSFAATSIAAIMMVGYVTYLSMPDISVRVAAAQAGINASMPDYKPSGYSLKGPVAFDDGEVVLSYAAHGSSQTFDLTQERSGWDSSAVRDYYVRASAGDDYTITRDSGLTVYTWGNQAAWVNNGIFYSIDGDASLSPDQIRRIAVSI